MRFIFILLIALCAPPLMAAPRPPAILLADQVKITPDRSLIATGNVSALYDGTHLQAGQIRYDSARKRLIITGPVILESADGEIRIVADQAQLSQDLQNGLIQSAQMVLKSQLRLSADEIRQREGRYTELRKTVATSCKVCEDGRAPLWAIRAQSVMHDHQERQLYFTNAQLRIADVPVLYLPRLRMPDPSLERATGFLTPSMQTTSQLRTGIKIPYFIRLSKRQDLTITPYISPRTRTLETRYRQAYARGHVAFNGAITRDDLRPGTYRGYLFGAGSWRLRNDYLINFNLETASDRSYLTEYEYSLKDRLESGLYLTHARQDELRQISFTNYKTLRDGEDSQTLPTNVFHSLYERRIHPGALGGQVRLGAAMHSHVRRSNRATDGPDDDLEADGRDVLRVHLASEWLRTWQPMSGLNVQSRMGVLSDTFRISDDSAYPARSSSVTPQAALTLRYPLIRSQQNAQTQLIEPIAQFAWVGGTDLSVPNDESTQSEFDEGNLLSLSRFARADRRERGTSAALGLNWSYLGTGDMLARVSVGQIFRRNAADSYTEASGLRGTSSDLLVASHLRITDKMDLAGRTLFQHDMQARRAELRGRWSGARSQFSGSYTWLTADAAQNRPEPISELTIDGNRRLSHHWSSGLNWRYDLEDRRSAHAGLGLNYDNECISARFHIRRRYTSSTSVEPSTNIGFTVSLRGFSAQTGTESYARACN